MKDPHSLVVIVTILSLLVYFWMTLRVGGARGRSGVAAPAMTGDPDLERHIRVHLNTLEWLPIYLTSLWLFTLVWPTFPFNEWIAVACGLVWMLGRIIYALSYVRDPGQRSMGFLIQFLGVAVLLFGALGKAIYVLATVGR
ncbi:MAG TPA: MAPEG family protein [Caulobacter sp.]|nr:MAPEG family protein [Caulobacter sp.]